MYRVYIYLSLGDYHNERACLVVRYIEQTITGSRKRLQV